MKKPYSFLFLFFLLSCRYASAQEDSSFTLVRTYTGDIADAAVDNLNNLYIVSSVGQIKKFTPVGDSVVSDNIKRYGKLYSLDATNPLKLLLFYKDFSTIIILDRFMANIATIDLKRMNILQPDAIGLSYDNNIWVYDEYDGKLKKIDEQGNQLLETPDFRNLFNLSIAPQRIINDNGFVYIADTANGVFVFDNYGSFKKKIPLVSWQNIAINNNKVITFNKEIITVFNTSTLMQTQQKAPFFRPYIHSFTTANKFVTFSTDMLHVYQYRF